MKKPTEKKATATKKAVKKTETKSAAKAPAKKSAAPKKAAKKECCGKKDCACGKAKKGGELCLNSLISEVFAQLQDTDNLSTLMKDYFFTELLRRGIEENTANTLANKLEVQIESFEANIDFNE